MIIVKVENSNIDRALKTLKKKTRDTKQLQELRERKEYIKPSVSKRKMNIKAKYKQSKNI
ncbi:30S ribosomal protein S21 [bacterium]|nr:30S ribosomal protein S21 [bacterium]